MIRVATAWARLGGLFFYELTMSVKDVIVVVINPRIPIRSAIVAVPLDLKSEAGITLLANMITLTPGTTSLHVNEEGTKLYTHVMNISDESVHHIKDGFERRVKEVLS